MKIALKYFFQVLLLLSLFIGIQGCCDWYKDDCKCQYATPSISLVFNFDSSSHNSFPDSARKNFYLIRTQKDFTKVDSSLIFPNYKVQDSLIHKTDTVPAYQFKLTYYNNYNYILANRSIGYYDTILNITYNESTTSINCSCKKTVISCQVIDSLTFFFNNNPVPQFKQPYRVNKF
jgi:hypothetical protein